MKSLAPIVLFVYNRPEHTLRTLEALTQNDLASESLLYIFCDGPKTNCTKEDALKISEVREVVKSRQWCKTNIVVERDINVGLAENITSGVSEVIESHGRIIVLEDDIVTSRGFLKFMNDSLTLYQDNVHVMNISGYMYPLDIALPDTIFLNVVTPWGWATWKRAWKYFERSSEVLFSKLHGIKNLNLRQYNRGFGDEFYNQLLANREGRLKTWAVKWHTSIFLMNGFCLHPGKSLVENIGFDGSGENCGQSEITTANIVQYVPVKRIDLVEHEYVLEAFHLYYLKNAGPKHLTRTPLHFHIIERFLKNFTKAWNRLKLR